MARIDHVADVLHVVDRGGMQVKAGGAFGGVFGHAGVGVGFADAKFHGKWLHVSRARIFSSVRGWIPY